MDNKEEGGGRWREEVASKKLVGGTADRLSLAPGHSGVNELKA